MSTSTISGTDTTYQSQQAQAAPQTKQLDGDAFLKLLTAQLANQDPLSPVDNQAFVAQLAQFSSVEQLKGLSSRLDTLLLATASQNQMSTANLVGKNVTYRATSVDLDGKTAPGLQARLEGQGTVMALVTDESGRTVRTLAVGSHPAGTFDLGWDGKGDAGQQLPPGRYDIAVSAVGPDGVEVPVEARGHGQVSGVTFDGDAAELVVGGNHVKLPDVVGITQV